MKTLFHRGALRLLPLTALLVVTLSACAGLDRSMDLAEQAVTPISVGEQRSVSAYDLARAMLRAGFTDQQILRDGPGVQAALATAGGSSVRYGKVTAAIFAVHGDNLYVSSNSHGTFTIRLGDPA